MNYYEEIENGKTKLIEVPNEMERGTSGWDSLTSAVRVVVRMIGLKKHNKQNRHIQRQIDSEDTYSE